MADLTREMQDFRDETVARSLPLVVEPRYSSGLRLASFAAGFEAAQDDQAEPPEALTGDAAAAWRHGRVAGRTSS